MRVPDSELAALFHLEAKTQEGQGVLAMVILDLEDALSSMEVLEQTAPSLSASERIGDRIVELRTVIISHQHELEEGEDLLHDLAHLIKLILDGQWTDSEMDVLEGVEGFSD